MIKGSYHNGFAPRDMAPMHPGLWRQCVGAWEPGLGPAGATLFDWAGKKRNGVLTNATLSTAWANNVGWSFVGSGTNSYVDASLVDADITGLSQCTLCFWVNRVASQNSAVMRGTVGRRFGALWFTDNRIYACCESTTSSYVYFLASATGWRHVAMIYDGSLSGAEKIRVAIDGVDLAAEGNLNTSSIPSSLAAPSTIGMSIGADRATSGGLYSPHAYDGIRIYSRVLDASELRLLASRRGIAYESHRRPPRYIASGFNPAWALNRTRIIGQGLGL